MASQADQSNVYPVSWVHIKGPEVSRAQLYLAIKIHHTACLAHRQTVID